MEVRAYSTERPTRWALTRPAVRSAVRFWETPAGERPVRWASSVVEAGLPRSIHPCLNPLAANVAAGALRLSEDELATLESLHQQGL